MEEESDFISGEDLQNEWSEITLVEERSHSVLYRGKRYGRWFMLKTLRSEHAEMSAYRLQQQKEFAIGVKLQHPYIAEIYSYEMVRGMQCIVQEYVDGVRLDEWLSGGVSKKQKTRVLAQLLEVLAYLHKAGLIHNDIKPANIMVTRNGGNVRLIDFGLSVTDDSATRKSDLSGDMMCLRKVVRIMGLRPLPKANMSVEKYIHQLDTRRKCWQIMPYVVILLILTVGIVLLFTINSIHERRLDDDAVKLDSMSILLEQDKLIINELRDSAEVLHEKVSSQANHIFEIETSEKIMMKRVDDAFRKETATWRKQIEACSSFREASMLLSELAQHAFVVRDKVVAEYDENDPLNIKAFNLWVHKQTMLQNELFSYARDKFPLKK